MRKFILPGLLAVLVTAAPASADFKRVEAEGRYWMTELSGDVRVDDTIAGTRIDFENDLGLDDEGAPDLRVGVRLTENNLIRFAYTGVDYSETNTIMRSFVFDGQTYTAGASISSDLELQYYRLAWIWDGLRLGEMLKAGPMVELKGFNLEAGINAPALGLSEEEDFFAGLPTIGAVVEITPIKYVSVFGEVSGISGGSYGYFLDVEGGVKINPCDYFSVIGGYRFATLSADVDEVDGELTLSGPFVGGEVRF